MAGPGCDMAAVAAQAYAEGAKSLEAMGRALAKKVGGKVPDDVVEAAFLNAAERYRRDFRAVEEIKAQMVATVAAEVRKNRPTGVKVGEGVLDVVQAGRSSVTSLDLSAPLRQGSILTLSNPRLAVFNRESPFVQMLGAAFGAPGKGKGEEIAHIIDAAIRTRPNAPLYRESGLHLSEISDKTDLNKIEEAYRSRIADRLPWIRGSERAYVTYLNKLRADTFDMYVRDLSAGGKREVSAEELQGVAEFINVATGRGTGSVADGAAKFLNGVLFSPRYTVSRFQLALSEPAKAGVRMASRDAGQRRVGRVIARTYAQYLGAVTATVALAEFSGATVEKDRRSEAFGKLRWPNGFEVDFLAGMGQTLRFLTNEYTGEKKKGATVNAASRTDTLGRFARSKASPLAGSIVDALERTRQAPYRKDFIGRSVGDQGGVITKAFHALGGKVPEGRLRAADYYLTKNAIPMSLPEVIETAKEEGVSPAAAVLVLSQLGAGASVIDKERRAQQRASNPKTLLEIVAGKK